MNLKDFQDAVGDSRLQPRMVRFLTAEGILASPGPIRTKPDYTAEHVNKARHYFRMRDLGFDLPQIRLMTLLEIAPGVVVALTQEAVLPPDLDALAQSLKTANFTPAEKDSVHAV